MEEMNNESIGYEFIKFLSEEVVLVIDNNIVNMNSTMLHFLGGDINFYIGKSINIIFRPIEHIQADSSSTYTTVMHKYNGIDVNIKYNVTWLDKSTRMFIIKEHEDIVKKEIFDLKNRTNVESYLWILESTISAIFIYNCYNKVIYANSSAVDLSRSNNYDCLVGKKIEDVIPINIRNVNKVCVGKGITDESKAKTPSFEQKIVLSDGVEIITEISALSYLDNNTKNTVVFIRDITEKKQAIEDKINWEKTLNSDKFRTELLSNLSHEFRTPINLLLGSLQLIETLHIRNDCEHQDVFGKYFKIMRQNSYRLLKLVNNLLDITSINSGNTDVNLINGDIINYVEDICQSVVDYAKHKGISIVFDTDIEEKVMAYDSDKIEKIMLNLLSNAIKFNKSGGLIDVSICDEQDSILISVRDNGIGIPADMKDMVFNKFTQVDNLYTRETEGSGNGLFLVKSLVEAMNGIIWVESEIGKGSNFIIKLPVKVLSENENKEEINKFPSQDKIERIDIELSDLYAIE